MANRRRKAQPEIAEPVAEVDAPKKLTPFPVGVPVGTLAVGAEFNLNGDHYRVNRIDPATAQVRVMFLEWSPLGDTRIEKYPIQISADELVKPA